MFTFKIGNMKRRKQSVNAFSSKASSTKEISLNLLVLFFLFASCLTTTKAQTGLVCGESITITEVDSMDFIIPDGADNIKFDLKGGDGGRFRLSGLSCDISRDGGEGATVTVEYEIGAAPNQLKAGGMIRVYPGDAGFYETNICASLNPNTNTSGGGSTGILYLPPGSATSDDWYLLAVAGGGGGIARPIAGVFRSGRGGNASERGSNEDGNIVGTVGHCGKATLVGIRGAFTGVGFPGGGVFCANSGDQDPPNTVVDSAYYDNDDNVRIRLKDFEYDWANGGVGFTAGGDTDSDRGAGGGGGFSGGHTRSNYGGGGGGSYVNEYFANLGTVKIDGLDDGDAEHGHAIIETKGTSRLVAICQDVTVTKDAFGDYILLSESLNGGSITDCNESMDFTFIDDSYSQILDCSNLVQTITLKVSLPSGLVETCAATVTLVDDVAPTITCKNATLYLDANGNAQLQESDVLASVSDDCEMQGVQLSKNQFDCDDIGTQSITLTATDVGGNQNTCTAMVTIVDNLPPVPNNNLPSTITFTCGGSLVDQPTATDNCGAGIGGTTNDPLTYAAEGEYTVTWEYKDASGNTSTSTQTVIVQSGVLYVDKDASAGQQTGDSWVNAFSHLHQALNAAATCTGIAEIWVAEGTYIPYERNETIVFGGDLARKEVFYIAQDGIQLYGGFSGLTGA